MKSQPKIEKEKLLNLYEEYKSIHKVGSILKVSGDTVSRWLKYYQIKILNDPKRFDNLREIKLSNLQKEFVVGSLLGDGNIDKKANHSRLRFCHGAKQIEYLNWKREMLSQLVVQHNNIVIQKTRNSTMNSFQTISHPELTEYYNLFYNNKIKIVPQNIQQILTPFSIAVWFMDDGWRSQQYRSALFCTDSFTLKENQLLVDALQNKFDIKTKLLNSSNRIVLYKEEVDKLSNLIKPYIIPSMTYKLGT